MTRATAYLRALLPLALAGALAGCCGGDVREAEAGAGKRPPPPRAPLDGKDAPDARPPPPYTRFDGVTFEPSAVAYDPATERVLVCSDKDAILYRYRLHDGRLELPKDERHRAFRFADGRIILKIESMTRVSSGEHLAATAFDRDEDDFRRVIRFRFAKKGPIEATEVPLDVPAITARLQGIDPGITWWKIEGLAVTAKEDALLLGVRSVGRGPRDKRDVVWIVRCPRRGAAITDGAGPPDLVVRLDGHALARAEGCSSLERDPSDGSFLMCTSWEDEKAERGEGSVSAHAAHLFRLPAALLEGPAAPPGKDPPETPLPAPLRGFQAKAEGLTLLPDGRALVIFDDDQAWKKNFQGYEQNQGLFLLLEAADLRAAGPPR